MGILNIITYLPLIGALVILFFIGKEKTGAIKIMATVTAVIDFVVSLYLWFNFDAAAGGNGIWQFRETYEWIPSLGVKYDFGIDGIVNGVRHVTVFGFGHGSSIFDRYVVDGAVNGVGWSAKSGSTMFASNHHSRRQSSSVPPMTVALYSSST